MVAATKTTEGRRPDPVRQFSIFTANKLGRLHDLIGMLGSKGLHVLAIMVLDTTESSVIRVVVDDPDQTRRLLIDGGFPFIESDLVVVELNAASDLSRLMSALLEVELNANYLYSFIPHPGGKSLLALSMEDNEIAEQALKKHQFRVLRQMDISR